jgi:hypothetical protein
VLIFKQAFLIIFSILSTAAIAFTPAEAGHMRSRKTPGKSVNNYHLKKESTAPSKGLTDAIAEFYPIKDPELDKALMINSRFSFVETDLNQDGVKEAIVVYRSIKCFNRGCYVDIFKTTADKKKYKIVGESDSISTRQYNLEVGLLPTRTNGWQDLAVEIYSYETRTTDWYSAKFDGKSYQASTQKLKQRPKKIILSRNSQGFDLPDLLK